MDKPTFAEVLTLARSLSVDEQHSLISTLSEELQEERETPDFPAAIHQAPPIDDINILVAPFWPEDESADDIIDFIRDQREQDRYT